MKVGDLLMWKADEDIGIVVDIQPGGLPSVRWVGEAHLHNFDYDDVGDAELLNEHRRSG